jgi:hypothetical protein
MKLMHCTQCNDVVSLLREERRCRCGKAWGHYLSDDRVVEYGGPCRIIGIRDREFLTALPGEDHIWFVIPELHNIRRVDNAAGRTKKS